MFIYNNTCSVNSECQSGYSLYFPCVSTINRGENVCFDFYIVDNSKKEEVDLREVDDITLNLSGRYNCNFGSFSYPENIKSLQVEKFSESIYDIDFSNIINNVNLYIDIVDENHNLIESVLYKENSILDIAIEGTIGYFLNNYKNYSVLNLTGYDTKNYMFLGWNIDENDGECDIENKYNYLIDKKNLIFNIDDNYTIRAVYQKRRTYNIQMAGDNYNSSFIVDYMGKQTVIKENSSVAVLEGHYVKVSCIPNDIKPYKFINWDDGYRNPHRVLYINGDELTISLKANCQIQYDEITYIDNIDANALNKFKTIYPEIRNNIFVDEYYIDNIYVFNCEIDVLDNVPYIKIVDGGYIQILNINTNGNLKLSINNIGSNCILYIDNNEVLSSIVDKNDFIFEYTGGILTLTGEKSCVFGIKLNKEVIFNKGKSMLCLSSDETSKLHIGELTAEGGIIVNGNPYGIPSVTFANVSNITPLIINKK